MSRRAMMVRSASGGVGDPSTIAGSDLLAWYKRGVGLYVDLGVTPVSADGDVIDQWNDQSGNGYHLIRETSAGTTGPITWRPGTTFNGVGSMEFNPGNAGVTTNTGWFKIPNALGTALNSSGGEQYVSYKKHGTGNAGQGAGCDMTASSDHYFFPFGSGGVYSTFGVTTRVDAITSTILDDNAFHGWNERAASGQYDAWIDTTQVQTLVSRTISFRTTGSVWGVDDSRGLHINGYVCELVFTKPLGSTARSNMRTYMTT